MIPAKLTTVILAWRAIVIPGLRIFKFINTIVAVFGS